MLMLTLQSLTTALVLMFGVVALLVALRHAQPGVRRDCWLLTGCAFVFFGCMKVVQEVGAIVAFAAGPGSAAWQTYLELAPAANHARGFTLLVFIAMLGTISYAKTPLRGRWLAGTMCLLIAGAVAGATYGLAEGELVRRIHYPAIAASSSVMVLLLAIGLLVHLVRSTMDRVLWICFCVFGVHLATDTLLMGGFAWIGVQGAWHPSPLGGSLADLAAAAVMSSIATYALVLTRRGVHIPALLEHPQPIKSAALP